MDDLPNDTPDVTVLLGEIQVPKLGGVLVEIGVGSEDSTRFPLGSDNSLFGSVDCTMYTMGYVTYTHFCNIT